MPLIDTQTGAIEVGHTVTVRRRRSSRIYKYIIEAFILILIAGVRHGASTVFGSSSGGAGSSADAQLS